MSSSVLLSQDLVTSLPGVNLKWAYTGISTVKEISLIYFKNTSDADISSVDIASGLTRYNMGTGLVSGADYTYQLQVVDVSNNIVYSNALALTSPYFLTPPTVQSVIGLDSALRVQLASTSNNLSGAGHTVEFVLKRADNVVFWIVKQFMNNGLYTLSSTDDARLTNNTSYRVACMFQPSPTSTQYLAPSGISNSISAVPSNLPNAPTSVTASSVGSGSLDISVSWVRPSDFSEWSSTAYLITVMLISSLGEMQM